MASSMSRYLSWSKPAKQSLSAAQGMRQSSVMSRPLSMRGVNSWPNGLCQYGSSARTDLETSSSGPVLTCTPGPGRAACRQARTATRSTASRQRRATPQQRHPVHQTGLVLLDEDAAQAGAGEDRAAAPAEASVQHLPQRRMAQTLELRAGPVAGLDLQTAQ